MHQNYICYKDGNDLLDQILTSIASELEQPPLIIVPADGVKFFKKTDKWNWIKKLIDGLNKIYGAKTSS